MTRLVITQYRSSIGEKITARRTLVALGLRHTGQTVEQNDSQALRGMLRRVAHLVEVTQQDAKPNPSRPGASPAKPGESTGLVSGKVGHRVNGAE